MPFCRNCGAQHDDGASFCATCGLRLTVSPPAGKPARFVESKVAANGPREDAGARGAFMDGLVADWLLVAATTAVLIAVIVAISVVYGTVLAVATTGDLGAATEGMVIGLYLPFAAFGATIQVLVVGGSAEASLSIGYLPLGLTAGAVASTWFALRAITTRQGRPEHPSSFVAKLAVLAGCALTVASSLLDRTDPNGAVIGDIDPRRTLLGVFVVVGLTGLAWSIRAGTLDPSGLLRGRGWARALRPIGRGATAFVGLCALAGGFAIVAALFAADDWGDRLRLVVGFPLVGCNLVLVSGVAALGATITFGLAEVSDLFGAGFGTSATGTFGLFRYGFPPAASTGSAPFVLLVVFLLAGPALLAAVTARAGEEGHGAGDRLALVVGTTAGFIAAAGLAALGAQVELFGDAEGVARDVNFLVVRADLVTVVGYSALWGLLGSLGGVWILIVRQAASRAAGADATPEPGDPAEVDPVGSALGAAT